MDVRVRFFGKIQKRILSFWGAYPKTDHESIKSTLRVDSSDQIQIQIFEIHNLNVFLGKGFKKNTFDKRFFQKKWYVTDVLHVWHSKWTYVGGAPY